MSLYGALFSGVSGLSAQSSAMGAIADNVANVNTIGYKGTNNQFQTLVTKQVSLTKYSPGGVQSKPRSGIDVQGLLSSTSSATDLGISGSGFFVVNEAANPVSGNRWAYTRAGSFETDSFGYLTNSGGYYLQAWTLMPYDGSEGATTVTIDGLVYMKAYQDTDGTTTYINDNIIDSDNLKPINLNTIGGSANPTKQIQLGANLPADASVYDPSNPDDGGLESLSVLIYDSLGNAHNINFEYTKTASNAWSLDAKMPDGAATQILYSNREVADDESDDVYAARAQIEFTDIPQNHSYISLTDETGQTYIYEFVNNSDPVTYVPTNGEEVVRVDISSGVVVASDAVEKLCSAIQDTFPSGSRFTADNETLAIEQSYAGGSIDFDCSNCLETVQASAAPDPTTGIPSGQFTLPEIDWAYKNVAVLNFDSTTAADYVNKTIVIDQQVYEFTTTASPSTTPGSIAINIDSVISGTSVDTAELATLLYTSVAQNIREPDRVKLSGTSIEFYQSTTGEPMLLSTSDNSKATLDGNYQFLYQDQTVTINGTTYTFTDTPVADTDVDISDITWGTSETSQAVMNRLKAAINRVEGSNSDVYQSYENSLVSGNASIISATSLATQYSTVTISSANDTLADYTNTQVTIDGTTYTLTNGAGGATDIDISGVTWGSGETTINELLTTISNHVNAYTGTTLTAVDGTTLIASSATLANGAGVNAMPGASVSAGNDTYTTTAYSGLDDAVYGSGKNNGLTVTSLSNNTLVISDRFSFNGELESEDGAISPAVRFNSDGTPKYITVDNMSIEWANGAEDMTGDADVGSKIELFMGNANTTDGLTHLSGDFTTNYLYQDGAKYGNFAGISIGTDGIVTALFDNGDTRPIAQIPLATFTNANGMEALTGNAWIETDYSGTATLRTATTGGAGDINSASLESSTVDLGEEFSTMITTQRAYSAAAKIITTADEMLDELISIKR